MKNLVLICLLICYNFCQAQSRTVKFKIVERNEISMPGVNILLKNSNPFIETQTDINGNAELILPKNSVSISLSFLAPSRPEFVIKNGIDSVKVDLVKKKVFLYSDKKFIKRINLKY
ncbi:hypothetical protein [Flavobacterium capsici]|uniref:Carboxypeptidase-like regulatory domain-containing protein n=1 Tax=Flavobacterium capsici TaxID=3075618 RepID=A0AA96EZD2_9FLAO|nr:MULTISPECIES: hypothetical protein [unclassified Flavobacterium]WNM18446.1 hypothetical protein RN608_10530 [Flavobacterium sp. PMR2A8]WNM22497.1 hypothetical protein RN605_03830 [Flavobacterium sp. PMTSA4]